MPGRPPPGLSHCDRHPKLATLCIRVQDDATICLHAQYFAHELIKRCPSDSVQYLAATPADELGVAKATAEQPTPATWRPV
jgi:hypothetical protein